MPLFLERSVTCQLEDITVRKHIETNPIYEQVHVSPCNNIASFGKVTNEHSCSGKEPCNKGKVCEDSSRSFPPLLKKPVDDDEERVEYVQMSALDSKYPTMSCSTSPRYTETPGTARKGNTISAD